MITGFIDKLRNQADTRFYSAATSQLIAEATGVQGFDLPSDHEAVLRQSNGIEVYGGYIRLFGMLTRDTVDATVWNQPDCWKFAWGDRCSRYWCFGGTAWGDQYAYLLDSLGGLRREPEVYFLSAFSMTPRVLASSFGDFFRRVFVPSATTPSDDMTRQARKQVGPLEVTYHVAYVPPLVFTGVEDVKSVHKMDARAAMICNGDIATQLDAGPTEGAVKAVEPYEDELHRMRLRLVWV